MDPVDEAMDEGRARRPLTRLSTREIAGVSRALLDAPLAASASLFVATCDDAGDTRGAFGDPLRGAHARGGGGGVVSLGPESVYVALLLARSDALVADADPTRIVNRYTRPLLAGLAKLGAPSMYGGRDFLASQRSPVAWVAFQHSVDTGRAAFEAVVGVATPFAQAPRRALRGRAAASLHDLGCARDSREVMERVRDAYLAAFPGLAPADVAPADTPRNPRDADAGAGAADARAELETEVGVVGAERRGARVTVFGDFYASREVVPRIESGLAAGMDVGRCLDAATDGAVVLGLPGLASLADVITRVR